MIESLMKFFDLFNGSLQEFLFLRYLRMNYIYQKHLALYHMDLVKLTFPLQSFVTTAFN